MGMSIWEIFKIYKTGFDYIPMFILFVYFLTGGLTSVRHEQLVAKVTSKSLVRQFLNSPSFENFEKLASGRQITPLFDFRSIWDGDKLLGEKIQITNGSIIKPLYEMEKKLRNGICSHDSYSFKDDFSFFEVNPEFVHGVPSYVFYNFKQDLEDGGGCLLSPYFDILYQFLNLDCIYEVINDESLKDHVFSMLIRLFLNVIYLIVDRKYPMEFFSEIPSIFSEFFKELTKICENIDEHNGSILLDGKVHKIIPEQIISTFLFNNVKYSSISFKPLIFPNSRLFVFKARDFKVNSDKGGIFEFNFNQNSKEYEPASVIIVYKKRGEGLTGFSKFIKLDGRHLYNMCGFHIFKKGRSVSYYPISKGNPEGKWFRFGEEGCTESDSCNIATQFSKTRNHATLFFYEKRNTVPNDSGMDSNEPSAQHMEMVSKESQICTVNGKSEKQEVDEMTDVLKIKDEKSEQEKESAETKTLHQ